MSGSSRPRRLLVGLLVGAGAGAWIAGAVMLWETGVPGDLARPDVALERYVPPAQLERAADYQAFLRIDLLAAALAQLVALGLFAVKGAAYVRESAAGRIGTGMLLGMLAMAFAWLARFPFSMAALWWQRRYDVTEIGYLDGALVDFLSAGGTFLFISLALLVVMAAARIWRRHWWVAAVPALLAIGLLAAFTGPYLLPDLERPRDLQLEADTRELAREQGTTMPSLRVQQTYGLTNDPNAGATGIGPTEHVIVWDNLLEEFSRAEVRFVLAHELAHLSRGHLWKGAAWLALLAIPIGLLVTRASRRRGGLAQPEAVPLAIFVVAVMLAVVAPLNTAFSQRLETEADWVGLETTGDPDAATDLLGGFVVEGLAAPEHPWWASLLIETHPSIAERIELTEAWRGWDGGGTDSGAP